MASNNLEVLEHSRISKFIKILTLKVAQIVIQSRQGNKVTHESIKKQPPDNDLPSSPTNLQWFNLSIPDEAEVESDTKQVLNGEVLAALSRVLCIEIALKTTEGDEMVLELWTVRVTPACETESVTSISTIYYRMGIMLKSTLSISRITPAYKIARTQNKESYKIYHKIYGGTPNDNLLGDSYKTIKISELRTSVGTIVIEVMYRTKMTILPDSTQKIDYQAKIRNEDILVKSDHFPVEIPRKNYNEKKQIDLSKPLTAGAFVDVAKIKELHDTLSLQLPPEPPMSWLIAEKEKVENIQNSKLDSIPEKEIEAEAECSREACGGARAKSRAIEMPGGKNDKYSGLMEFPFADGSPITELANFYQECLQARSASDEWTDVAAAGEGSASTDSESLSRQLKMFEDAVPEFDNMVASMFSNSGSGSDA